MPESTEPEGAQTPFQSIEATFMRLFSEEKFSGDNSWPMFIIGLIVSFRILTLF